MLPVEIQNAINDLENAKLNDRAHLDLYMMELKQTIRQYTYDTEKVACRQGGISEVTADELIRKYHL